MKNQIVFDHEKLDVYQLELKFVAWSTLLLRDIKQAAEGLHREVCDQLDRASLSALLNTAEGNGKRQGRLRAKFFDDARGSAIESAACLDALVARELASAERVVEGKTMLLRIVGMLTKLVERFDSEHSHTRSSYSKPLAAIEDEDEEEGRGGGEHYRPRPSSSSSSSKPHAKIEDENEEEGRGREGRRGGGAMS